MPARMRRQTIRERVAVVGLDSGRVYATADENGGKDPETIAIRNPGKKLRAPKQAHIRGARAYDLGGDLSIDNGADPNDPDIQSKIASGAVYYNAATNSVSSRPVATPRITPPAFNGEAGLPYSSGPQPTGTQQSIYNAQQGQLNARAAQIGASQGQLGAEIGADQAQAAYLAEQRRSAAATAADQSKLLAAQTDVAGNTAAAQAQDYQNNTAPLYRAGALAMPTTVTTAGGQDPGNLPLGTVAKVQTPAEVQQTATQGSAIGRNLEDTNARLNASEASLGATEAGRAVTAAGLQVQEAQLAESQATLAPPGTVYDAYSGTFMTPRDQAISRAQNAIVKDPVNGGYTTAGELQALTDSAGNILRAKDNTWVDPNTGNEYVNGTWIDPVNGGVYDDSTNAWNYADGTKWVQVKPALVDANGRTLKAATGYTVNAKGYTLIGQGEWRNALGDHMYDPGAYDPEDPQVQDAISSGRASIDAMGNLTVLAANQGSAGVVIGRGPDGKLTTGKMVNGAFVPDGAAGAAAGHQLPTGSLEDHLSGGPTVAAPASKGMAAIQSIFPADEQTNATKIALAESGGDPTKISPPSPKDGLRDYGLFQIHASNFRKLEEELRTPVNAQTILDPELNTRAALIILGWGKGKWAANWTTAKGLGIL